jgi:ABC-2 type transport system permease protein
MRAIWFVSQIALFGLIATRMISFPMQTLATSTAHLAPDETHLFQVNVSSGMNSIYINVSSLQGPVSAHVYSPNGTLVQSVTLNRTASESSFMFSFSDPDAGLWKTELTAGKASDGYSVAAYSGIDYFRYYVSGLSVMTLYSAAVFIGFDIYEEAEHGVFEYLLSLPVSRRQLVIGRSIGGGLRAFIYVGPLIAVSLYVIGAINPLNFLMAMLALFLFSFGVSGMSITIAVMIKSSDRFDILMGVLDALIVRLSTAMYPLAIVRSASPFYGGIANFNPVTFAADLFRWGTGIEAIITLDNPLLPLMGIVIFFAFFTFVGIVIYDRRIEGGGWK